MPFVIQCPHPACKKFILLEDEARGTTLPCLLCKNPLNVDEVLSQGSAKSESQDVRTCPKCAARMRVATSATRVRCPKCQTVF